MLSLIFYQQLILTDIMLKSSITYEELVIFLHKSMNTVTD